ncbi:MAG: TldD/PmbA family protein [Micromonosporaceae bacterium]
MTGELTGQVIDLVVRHAPAGTEAEVTAEAESHALTRFANSFIHQNVSETTTTVSLRLHTEGRTASGTTTVTDSGGLTGLVRRTLAASRLLPEDPHWPGVTPVCPATGTGHYDPATGAADPATRAAVVRGITDAAAGLAAAGYCRTTGVRASFANTAGHRLDAASSSAAVDAVARTGSSDGVARAAGIRLADIDGAALGAVAAAKARAAANPVDLEPGRYEVILEPSAVTDLVMNLALWGYNGKALTEGRSFVDLGAAQLDSAVNLVDDPVGATAFGLPFDTEGTPGRVVDLVRDGVSVGVAHDRRTAAEAKATSTGHATGVAFGPFAGNIRLEPGTAGTAATGDRPISDPASAGLLAGVRRGLLVTDLWYTRVLDPRTLVVTGLTRNGVWLIENGEIVRPVSNLRFTQSYPDGLGAGQVRAIGGLATTVPYHWGVVSITAPPVHLASWHFSGGAAG